MNNKNKSVLQIHYADQFVLSYMVEDYLLIDHLASQENEGIVHNVRYNHCEALSEAYVGVKISRMLIDSFDYN